MSDLKVARKIRNEVDRLMLFARHDHTLVKTLVKKDILKKIRINMNGDIDLQLSI